MGVDITFIDNSDKVMDAFHVALKQALTAIGMTAETHAKEKCPVDTGNLRNSIANEINMNEQCAIIGSNVEYAPFVELGTSRQRSKPYLRPAITDYSGEYKALANQAFKNA